MGIFPSCTAALRPPPLHLCSVQLLVLPGCNSLCVCRVTLPLRSLHVMAKNKYLVTEADPGTPWSVPPLSRWPFGEITRLKDGVVLCCVLFPHWHSSTISPYLTRTYFRLKWSKERSPTWENRFGEEKQRRATRTSVLQMPNPPAPACPVVLELK